METDSSFIYRCGRKRLFSFEFVRQLALFEYPLDPCRRWWYLLTHFQEGYLEFPKGGLVPLATKGDCG